MPDANRLVISSIGQLLEAGTRRDFLRLMGAGGVAVLLPGVLAACDDDDDPPGGGALTLDLSTDTGILQYAHALEQLEAAFYTQVVSQFDSIGITDATERNYLVDIRNHEIAHREFFEAALQGSAVPPLNVAFGDALASRQSVLETAQTFEDLGVAAYNGAGRYLEDPDFLRVAGKIVSVEARHAAAIHALLNDPNVFASFVNDDGLDRAFEPSAVLQAADPFIVTEITIGTQPS